MKQLLNKISYEKIYITLTFILVFVSPLSWKLSRVILLLIIATRLAQPNYALFYKNLKKSNFLLIFTIFSSYLLLSILWSEGNHTGTFRNFIIWFAVPIIAIHIKPNHIQRIISVFLSAMAISEVLAYGMYFNLWTIDGHGADYPSPFMHHTAYSIFMTFTAIILLNRLYSSIYTLKEKLIMGAFFLTVSGNLFISQGRIGQLTFAIAILLTGILHFKLKIKTLFISSILMLSIFFSAYQLSPMFQKRLHSASVDIKKIQKGNLRSSWGSRVAYIIVGTKIIKDYPIFGVGLGGVSTVAEKYFHASNVNLPENTIKYLASMHFHNQYLMVTVEGGFLALILFFILFYYFLKLPIKDRELKQLSILFATIFLVGFISDPFIYTGATRPLFLIFIALFTAASFQKDSGTNS